MTNKKNSAELESSSSLSMKTDLQEKTLSINEMKNSLEENLHEVLEEASFGQTISTVKSGIKLDHESNSESSSNSLESEEEENTELETCSARYYIENTVGQILLTALSILERERPENPINWLAEYLLLHKDDTPELKEPFFEQQTPELIKLPEHIKKIVIEDTQDLKIKAVNHFI